MMSQKESLIIIAPSAPEGIDLHPDYSIWARPKGSSEATKWTSVTPLLVEASTINLSGNDFKKHPICVASLDIDCAIDVVVHFRIDEIKKATILPSRYAIEVEIVNEQSVQFSLDETHDVMLMLNDNKWTSLHLLTNPIDRGAPHGETHEIWYFGPGLNNGKAYQKVVDGKLKVPSGITVYLAHGAFLTAGLHFSHVENTGVSGHGFLYKADADANSFIVEKRGSVLIESSRNISVSGVTSLSATGLGFLAGQSNDIDVIRYRSFSSAGNGDGLHFLSTSNVRIRDCFIRSSDDSLAINAGRWEYRGNTEDYDVRDCVFLPDIAHPILFGTHGDFENPSDIRGIVIRNIDILDHEEHQLWYQGCIALNAGDGNLIEDVNLEDIRVRKMTRGQLFNIRVMQNQMWTKGPGRGIRDVTIRNLALDTDLSGVVFPSQILGYNEQRNVEGTLRFSNLRVGGWVIARDMDKPRWYMAEDFVPVFVNEHVKGLVFEA